MPQLKGGCHRGCLHRRSVLDYRAARAAWEALRESDVIVDVAGAAGADVAAYQLEDDDFARAFPPPTFREWLIDHAGPRE